MDRRQFMERGMCGAAALSVLSFRGRASMRADANVPLGRQQATGERVAAVTAGDVHEYLRSLGDEWVNP